MEKAIICIVLCLVSIALSFYSSQISSDFSPAAKSSNAFTYFILFLTLASQLAAIYLTASKFPLLGALMMMPFCYYWYMFVPFHPNSDPAGNGMARAFHNLFAFVVAFFGGLFFFLITKFFASGGLFFCMIVAAIVGLRTIFSNAESYLSGSSLDMEARWNRMETEDYKKTLFRSSIVEDDDSWLPQHLGAEPKELDHWDVHGTKQIAVKTMGNYPCLLVEGHFIFRSRRVDFVKPSLCGYSTRADNGNANDRKSFMPNYVFMVWYDCIERKTYQVYSKLPEKLSHYFDNDDAFWLDDVEFRILPKGKLLMFHNRLNQIHDIMIDYPLQGKETSSYDDLVKNYFGVESIDAIISPDKSVKTETLHAEEMEDYLRRYNYSISFLSGNANVEIQKTICNFFNGEKILSADKWNETMHPSRLKDVFLRFKDEQKSYSCFVYFEENEIVKTFNDAFATDSSKCGEFVIKVGAKQEDFEFQLKVNDKCYPLSKTEFRLYENDESDQGSLLFKNYSDSHKNGLSFFNRMSIYEDVVNRPIFETEGNKMKDRIGYCLSAPRSNPITNLGCTIYGRKHAVSINKCMTIQCGSGEGERIWDCELDEYPLMLAARWESTTEQKKYAVVTVLPSQQIRDMIQDDSYWRIDFCFLPGGVVKTYMKTRGKSVLLDWEAKGTELQELDEYATAVQEEMKQSELEQERYESEGYDEDEDEETGDAEIEENEHEATQVSQQKEAPAAPKAAVSSERYEYGLNVTFEEKASFATSLKYFFSNGLVNELKYDNQPKDKLVKPYLLRVKWTTKEEEQYTGFFYFNSQEIDKIFSEIYGTASEKHGTFDIYVGKDNDDFKLTFVAEGQTYAINNTEVKVYYHTANHRRKDVLVYKNYKGEAKNLPVGEHEVDEYDCK